MNGISAKRLAVYQTTGIGFIVRVVFNDFAVKSRKKDFIKGKPVSLCLFIGVICNPNPIRLYCFDDITNVHRAVRSLPT